VQNGTGQAVVSTSGLVTAVSDGNVTITASATDGSGISDVFALTISNQLVLIKSITISSVNGSSSISEIGGSLQLVADINPKNASNPQVLWSIANESGWAEIDDSGLVTALTNGTVRAIASAADGSGVADDFVITISNQVYIEVENILVSSEDDMETITVDDGTLQLYAEIFPEDATDQRVLWEVCNVSGEATISETGLVRAFSDGIIYASASSVGNSHIQDYIVITISGQTPNEINVLQSEINYHITGNTLLIDNSSGYLSHIRIIDLNGRLLRNENLQAVERSIELWPFQKGIYILQFINGSSAVDNIMISLH
jgi:uncharacterized protein YjdB